MIKFGNNIGSVMYGSTPISKIYFGSDLVFQKDTDIVSKIINKYPSLQALINTYPHLMNRIEQYPNILFSLVNLNADNNKYCNYITQIDNLPLETRPFEIPNNFSVMHIKMDGYFYGGKEIKFWGSRTGYNSTDDTMTFVNEKFGFFGRTGNASGALFNLDDDFYLHKFSFDVLYNNTSSLSFTIDGFNRKYTTTSYRYSGLPIQLMGIYDGTLYQSNFINKLWVKSIMFNEDYIIPFNDKLYNINKDIFYTSNATNAYSCVVFDSTTNTIVNNPKISMLL